MNNVFSTTPDRQTGDTFGGTGALGQEENKYLADHSLKRPLRVLDIWALGVSVVITGDHFGWNLALKDNGPIAVLIA